MPPLASGEVSALIGAAAATGGVGTILLALRPFTKALCDNWRERCRRRTQLRLEEARRETRVAEIEAAGKAEVAKIREAGKVLRELAALEPDQAERLRGRLERVQPPPPDEIQPPAAS